MIDFIINSLLNMTPLQEKTSNLILILIIGIIIFLIALYIVKYDDTNLSKYEKKKSIGLNEWDEYIQWTSKDKDLYYIWWHEEGLDLFNEWKKEIGD